MKTSIIFAPLLLAACMTVDPQTNASHSQNSTGVFMRGMFLNVEDTPAQRKLAIWAPEGSEMDGWHDFGAGDMSTRKRALQDAAGAYLAQTGRRCEVSLPYPITEFRFEVRYDCNVPPKKKGPPRKDAPYPYILF